MMFLANGERLQAQSSPLTCSVSYTPVVVRSEGLRELLGDIAIFCSGGNAVTGRQISPANPGFTGPAGTLNGIPNQWEVQVTGAGSNLVPVVNLTVTLSQGRIANRIFPGSNLTDALLYIDEPETPESGSTVLNQNPCYAAGPLSTPGLCNGMRYFFKDGVAAGAGYPPNPVPLDPNTGLPLPGYTAPAIPGFDGGSSLAGNPINVYQAQYGLGGNFAPNGQSITFVGVPLVQPGPNGTRIFLIKNVRVEVAGAFSVSSTINASVSIQNPPANLVLNGSSGVLGVVQSGLSFDTIPGPTYLQSAGLNVDPATNNFFSPSNAASAPGSLGGALPLNTAVLRFTEAHAVSFKRRGFGGSLELLDLSFNPRYSPSFGQTDIRSFFNNESGVYNRGFLTGNWRDSGVASTGTRLRARFSGIPPGVRLYVSVAPITRTGPQNNFAYSTDSILSGAPTSPNLSFGVGSTSAFASAIGLSSADSSGAVEGLPAETNFFRTHPFAVSGSTADGFGASGAAYAGLSGLNRTTQLNVAPDGTATYTWEVLRADPNSIDRLDFLVQAAFLPGTPLNQNATIRVSGSFGPLTTALTNGFPYAPNFLDGAALNEKDLFSITADIGPDSQSVNCGAGGRTLIGAVNGLETTSPFNGQTVIVEGIVTGVYQGNSALNGFFIQDEGDGNSITADGIFVDESTGSVAGTVVMGQRLRLRGVIESNPSRTALKTLLARSCSVGNPLPQPVDVTLPATTLSRYRGMLVRFPQPLRVNQTNRLATHGEVELALVPNYITGVNYTRLTAPTQVAAPGAEALAVSSQNALSRITLDDGSNLSFSALAPAGVWPLNGGGLNVANTLRLGARVNVTNNAYTPLTGVLSATGNGFALQPMLQTFPITFNAIDNPRPAAPANVRGRMKLMSVNLGNYFTTYLLDGAKDQTEFVRQRNKLIAALKQGDATVLAFHGLENLAQTAIADLVNDGQSLGNSLNTGNPGKWAFLDTGVVGTGNTRTGFIYQPALVSPVGAYRALTDSIDPRAVSTLNRPAVAQTFRLLAGGKPALQHFTVVATQLVSRSLDCPNDPFVNDGQAFCNATRTSMARALADWLVTNPTNDPTPTADRRILLLGNFNAYLREDPISALTSSSFSKPAIGAFPALTPNANAIYRDLVDALGERASYSNAVDGASGSLQHGLANPAMFRLVTGVSEWHINADEPEAFDYQTDFRRFGSSQAKSPAQLAAYSDASQFRSSGQDPLLIGFNPLPGDLDDDGDVDANDQAIIRAAIGKPLQSVDRRTDFDGDGRITLIDFQRWAQYASAYLR